MENHYYNARDLDKFGNIAEYQKELADKFFSYYGEVFKDSHLTAKEKSLIALAVAHAVQCPYCIDAYTETCLKVGADEEQMMEAVHVAATMKAGITLVYSTQMMKHAKKVSM